MREREGEPQSNADPAAATERPNPSEHLYVRCETHRWVTWVPMWALIRYGVASLG